MKWNWFWFPPTQMFCFFLSIDYIPAIFRSRILRQSASAFRIGQFSIFVEKLRKKRYSFSVTDIRRAILNYFFTTIFVSYFCFYDYYLFDLLLWNSEQIFAARIVFFYRSKYSLFKWTMNSIRNSVLSCFNNKRSSK